ncbi:uncharacterized protein PG998_011387 [Apiospora kogelbergensis]|uniref:uncharacterized protein n=1 Tax=Apiospora kogelbergensis TaxID=1337665 RepID=UPI00312FA4B4
MRRRRRREDLRRGHCRQGLLRRHGCVLGGRRHHDLLGIPLRRRRRLQPLPSAHPALPEHGHDQRQRREADHDNANQRAGHRAPVAPLFRGLCGVIPARFATEQMRLAVARAIPCWPRVAGLGEAATFAALRLLGCCRVSSVSRERGDAVLCFNRWGLRGSGGG